MILFTGGSNASWESEEGAAAFQMCVMLHLFSMVALFLNNYLRGTRIHMYPLMMGFALYSLALFFGIYEEIAYYYYYLTLLVSLTINYFFGSTEFYNSFATSGR